MGSTQSNNNKSHETLTPSALIYAPSHQNSKFGETCPQVKKFGKVVTGLAFLVRFIWNFSYILEHDPQKFIYLVL
jgi:hypothetical protein